MATYLQSIKETPVLAGLGFMSHFFYGRYDLFKVMNAATYGPI